MDTRTVTLYRQALASPLWASLTPLECRLLPQVPLPRLSDEQRMPAPCCCAITWCSWQAVQNILAVHSRNGLLKLTFCAATTLTATYNDLDSVRQVFEANKDEIAGVILEPVVGNSGFIPPTQEFLEVTSARASLPHCSVEGGMLILHELSDFFQLRADMPSAPSRGRLKRRLSCQLAYCNVQRLEFHFPTCSMVNLNPYISPSLCWSCPQTSVQYETAC